MTRIVGDATARSRCVVPRVARRSSLSAPRAFASDARGVQARMVGAKRDCAARARRRVFVRGVVFVLVRGFVSWVAVEKR